MAPIKGFALKGINVKLLSSCILSVALIVAPVALADYTPPPDQRPSTNPTEGGTSRGGGCDGGDKPLIVLASRKYIGRTIYRHPTFAWFVPDSRSFEMEFTIYELSSNGKKGKEVFMKSLQSSPGIMKLSPFSKDEPGLEVGKEYFWEVAIICNPDNPASAIVDGASIELVETPPAVLNQLDKPVNSFKKVNIYAKAGLWYDALGEALKLAEVSKLGEVGSALLKDLAKREAPETISESIQRKCRRNNSQQESPGIAPELISLECRRNDLEQIANSAR